MQSLLIYVGKDSALHTDKSGNIVEYSLLQVKKQNILPWPLWFHLFSETSNKGAMNTHMPKTEQCMMNTYT